MDEIVTQMGLLLSQARFARRALEDIERATSTYGTYAFTSVITAGPKFGAPPLFDGALKVHVININDLAPGGGIGDLLPGLLGGAGSFLGNIPGGLVGGTLGSLRLGAAIPDLARLAERIERILKMLGIGVAQPVLGKPGEAGEPVAGLNLVATLEAVRGAVDALTGLFLAAGDQPDKAAGVSKLPETPEGARWKGLLDSTSAVLTNVSHLVDGLIFAVPLAISAIVWLIDRLPLFARAIAETLQFALRIGLILRGTLAVIVFDTAAMIARVAATAVGIIAQTLDAALSGVFNTLKEAVLAVIELGSVMGAAVKDTVDKLLDWLVPEVDKILRNLGDLPAFQVLTHVVKILPAVLAGVLAVKETPVPAETLQALIAASLIPFPKSDPSTQGAAAVATTDQAAKKPDFATDPDLLKRAIAASDRLRDVAAGSGLKNITDPIQNGLRDFGEELNRTAVKEAGLSDANLSNLLGTVRDRSKSLAESVVVAQQAHPATGLEAIASAYEGWLTGGGLNKLLGSITDHFKSTPSETAKMVDQATDTPRATVQIDEVFIELAAPPPAEAATPAQRGPGDYPFIPSSEPEYAAAQREWLRNFRQGIYDEPCPITA